MPSSPHPIELAIVVVNGLTVPNTTLLEGFQALTNHPSSGLVNLTSSVLDSAPNPGVFDGSGYSPGRMDAWIFIHSRKQ